MKSTRILAFAMVGSVALTACGGGNEASPGDAGDATATAVATETVGTGDSAFATADELQRAREDYERWQSPQGELGSLPPIQGQVPEDIKIDLVTCEPAACLIQPEKFEDAAALLGWEVNVIVAGSDPQEQQNAVAQAVRNQPDAVVYNGIDSALFERQLTELRDLNIPLAAFQTTDQQDPPDFFVIPGGETYDLLTDMVAASVVAGSEGTANVAVINVPAFPIYDEVITPGIVESIAEYCAACPVEVYDMPVTSLGKDHTDRIVNFLRGKNEINAVVSVQDVTNLGLRGALDGAGLSDVMQFGVYPSNANLPEIANGNELAAIPNPYDAQGWLMADALARVFAGESPEPSISATPPLVIWNDSNVPSDEELLPIRDDLDRVFSELWGK